MNFCEIVVHEALSVIQLEVPSHLLHFENEAI